VMLEGDALQWNVSMIYRKTQPEKSITDSFEILFFLKLTTTTE